MEVRESARQRGYCPFGDPGNQGDAFDSAGHGTGLQAHALCRTCSGRGCAVFERNLAAAVARLAQQYPGLTAVLEPVSATVSSKEAKTAGKAALRPVRVLAGQPSAARMRIVVPAGSDPGHEAHFASVFRCYTDYLVQGMPQWERDAILAKYYITTKAHAMAQQKR